MTKQELLNIFELVAPLYYDHKFIGDCFDIVASSRYNDINWTRRWCSGIKGLFRSMDKNNNFIKEQCNKMAYGLKCDSIYEDFYALFVLGGPYEN